jgi:hypothetical protein
MENLLKIQELIIEARRLNAAKNTQLEHHLAFADAEIFGLIYDYEKKNNLI